MNVRFQCECPLAWLYGDFTTGIVELGLERPEIFGFYIRGDQEDPRVIARSAELTEARRDEGAFQLIFVSELEMEMERTVAFSAT